MTQAHKVEFVIKPTGEVEFVVKGIKGGGCRDVQKSIEAATGIQTTSAIDTGEMYEQAVTAEDKVQV